MSGPFSGLAIPASGMHVYKTWIDALSDNVANVNTVTSTNEAAFQELLGTELARFRSQFELDGVEPKGGITGWSQSEIITSIGHRRKHNGVGDTSPLRGDIDGLIQDPCLYSVKFC